MRILGATLNNGGTVEFGDFNTFGGGNGVGKSSFITELYLRSLNGHKSKFFWIKENNIQCANIKENMNLLKNSLQRKHEGPNLTYYSPSAKNIDGNVDNSEFFTPSEYDSINSIADLSFLAVPKYIKPFITFASCEARLNFNDSAGLIGLSQPPQDPINLLYRDKKLLKRMANIVFDIFKRKLVILDHNKITLHIGLSKNDPPTFDLDAEDSQVEYYKIEAWKNEYFTPISEAGHGIRSMIKLLMTVLDPVNQIIIIDEPEMHLFRAHKRWIGKLLVELAKKQEKQVFLVTHDSLVFQSIIESDLKTDIFIIDRDKDDVGRIKSCGLDNTTEINSIRNQPELLQAIFYQYSIIVEGASDRALYQNTTEDLSHPISEKDLGFVISSGAGMSKHVSKLVTQLNLKAAFIFDYDVLLKDLTLIKDIFKTLGGQPSDFDTLENLLDTHPSVKEATDKYKAIKALCGYSDRFGMTSDWAKKNIEIFDALIKRLQKKGIFIVPNGSLESWAPEVEAKQRFAEYAPAIIANNTQLALQFICFFDQIFEYLEGIN